MTQIIIFGVISIFTLILAGSLYSLKKEISRQQHNQYIKNKTIFHPSIIYIPYSKSRLPSLLFISVLSLIAVLYLLTVMVFQNLSNPNILFQKETLETVTLILFLIIIILVAILLITVRTLMRRIKTPLYYEYKICSQCNSSDISKVEYSWWGGLLGPYLVHEVRCKRCDISYDRSTGRNIKKPILLYFTLGLIFSLIFIIVEYFFS